ncbi:MAG: ATP-dependent helicase, partial [candidate division Zixibacteria bacterium]|nr:ATP-dependent helicase [candidate division Zixibacteria bacterium]NIR65239.1 ATP-dependent helicase [candidate division Zixibacteria bacterium]NIS14875.1 ATP-dependent helicase [candidate division Zixibacteria bacterium]NIS46975.1 ATP-dependent helicase [candidate division Zixibacteria bacterium]NIT51397.1 ATP-dependent helicase [candidate division Zixibacteria bacterium]
MEQIQKAGEDSFVTYSIPNAVLKFKQGFGRLIRQKTDTGVIIVTDNRLIKSNYGQIFLNSIPTELNVIYSQDEFLDRIRSL